MAQSPTPACFTAHFDHSSSESHFGSSVGSAARARLQGELRSSPVMLSARGRDGGILGQTHMG